MRVIICVNANVSNRISEIFLRSVLFLKNFHYDGVQNDLTKNHMQRLLVHNYSQQKNQGNTTLS